MKSVLQSLLCGLALFCASAVCRAQMFQLSASTALVDGEPQAIYEVTPGTSASVTIATTSNYSCQNVSGSTRTAYLSWQPQVYLRTQPGGVSVLENTPLRQTNITLTAGATWNLNNDMCSATGGVPEGYYHCYGLTYVTEDKTGEVSNLGQTSDFYVTVRPFA